MESSDHLELFIKGSIVGHLIGDALGHPYEGLTNTQNYEIDMIEGRHGESPGCWTMPGAFSLATISTIVEYEGVYIDDLLERFNDVYIAGHLTPENECKDIGTCTTQTIQNFTTGMPPDRCGVREQYSDNDCLLRMLPIGIYYATSSIDEITETSHLVCRLTHADTRSQVCCAAYSLIIRNLVLEKAEKIFDVLDDYYRVKEMSEFRSELDKLKSYRGTAVRGTKHPFDSFWSAWNSHVGSENDFACCVTDAIHLGGDTNGTAALAGSFSGLANGLNDIPSKWLRTLKLTSEVMEITQEFTNQMIRKLTQV